MGWQRALGNFSIQKLPRFILCENFCLAATGNCGSFTSSTVCRSVTHQYCTSIDHLSNSSLMQQHGLMWPFNTRLSLYQHTKSCHGFYCDGISTQLFPRNSVLHRTIFVGLGMPVQYHEWIPNQGFHGMTEGIRKFQHSKAATVHTVWKFLSSCNWKLWFFH